MPNQQKQQKKKTGGGKGKAKPKPKPSKKPGKAVTTVSGSNQVAMRYMPPQNMSAVIRSGPKLSFSSGSRAGCLKMHYEFRLAQVVVAPTGTPTPYLNRVCFKLPGNGVPNSYAFEIPVAPMNSWYFPTYLRQLILLFNEFRVLGMTLSYQPRQSTTSSNAFVWAYAEDVMWPESHGLLSGGAVVLPTEFALTSLSSACTSLSWAPCVLRANITDNKMRYVAGSQYDGQLNYTSTTAALDRQTFPGIFMIFSDTTLVAASETVLGDVYASLTMEMCDFSIPINNEIAFKSGRREKLEEKYRH